ncbi:hypothetical protein HZC30_04320 [Candidatus Woesearchaeota archaeon]|nr:hypothetical protein [Candidatus Woesearchaeota archaeon]
MKTMILEVLTATLLAGLGGCSNSEPVEISKGLAPQSVAVPVECNKPLPNYIVAAHFGPANYTVGEFCDTKDGRVLSCYYTSGKEPVCYELNTFSQLQEVN